MVLLVIASKFDMFKGAFNGKGKIFDTTLNEPIEFIMDINIVFTMILFKGK